MGFGKDEAGSEEAPAFGNQAVTDGTCRSMGGGINEDASCLGRTASPHACL